MAAYGSVKIVKASLVPLAVVKVSTSKVLPVPDVETHPVPPEPMSVPLSSTTLFSRMFSLCPNPFLCT